MIKKKPFRKYSLDEKTDTTRVIPVKMNEKEQEQLKLIQELLQQEQESTAIKQSLDIVSNVLLDKKTMVILSHVLNNYRRNKRKGVVTFDDTNYEKYINRNTFESP